jgi:outer membrane receptor protein involved in Fe transport
MSIRILAGIGGLNMPQAVPLAALMLISSIGVGQSYRGSIRGTVKDAQGAVIAGASVTARNMATDLARTATSASDGGYVIPELPAGEYELKVVSGSFSPVMRNVVVAVGTDTTADMTLANVAQIREQVTVTAAASLVETSRDVLGEVVGQRLVTSLPLNGRDFGKLVALVPGTTVEPSGVAAIQSGFGQFSINGNRDRSNNYTLDGTDNNDPFFNNSAFNQTGIGGAPASLLPIDAIEEFNLQSHFPAEYGRNTGSVINIISKSGTNDVHGSLFYYMRNSWLDARNYFNRAPAPQGQFRNHQFGASLGGPVIKDKTFFFGAYEGQRERGGSAFTFLVPTASQIAAAQGKVVTDGFTVNPALTSVLKLFPQPTGVNPVTGTGALAGNVNDTNNVDSFIAKLDHTLSRKEQLSGRYALAQSDQLFPLGGLGSGAASRFAQFAQKSPTRVQLISTSLLSTLSPTRVNEVRFGYSRYRTSFSSADQMDPTSLGLTFGTGKLGLPEIDFSGFFDNLGTTGFSVPRGRTSQSFQYLDNFTLLHGRHTLKFGGEYRRAAVNSFNDNLERGLVEVFAGSDPISTLVNFYEGSTNFTAAATGNTQRNTINNGFSFFGQDDFRARPHLTLNLGLRWEYFGPLSESHGLISNLAPDGTLAIVGTHGLGSAYKRDLNNFGPRIGFAWNARSSTVVRGGYGIYYDYIPQDLLIANFTNSSGLVTNPVGPEPVLPLFFSTNAWTGVPNSGPIFQPGGPPFDIFFTPRNLVAPYAQNYNLNLEQMAGQNLAFEIGYVGGQGRKLVRLLDANQPDITGTRPNPNFGFMDAFCNCSASSYNALQLTTRMRNWHGLSGFAGYTWSKSLDDASDGIDFNFATVAIPQNSNNLRGERGSSNFDTRHRLTTALTYEVPRLAELPHKVGEGWQINAIFSAQSGRPVPIVSANDSSAQDFNTFPTPANFHQRPNLVLGVNPIVGNWESAPDTIGYLNPAAFAQPRFGTFGNLGRNAIFGPGYWGLDFALAKNTQLFERLNIQFRAEFFNILNHPNFALPNFFITPKFNPDGSVNTSATTAGLITQTPDVAQTNPGLGGGGPRVIQLALRFTF